MPRHNSHAGKPKELGGYRAAPFLLHTLKTTIIYMHTITHNTRTPTYIDHSLLDTAAACISEGCSNDLAIRHVPNDTAEC